MTGTTDASEGISPALERLLAFTGQNPVHEYLLTGVDVEAPDAWTIISNFAQSGFQWTGHTETWQSVLAGNFQGDCKSLVEACEHLLRDGFGFEGVGHGYYGNEFFMPGGGTITDGRTGNVDGGEHWVFTNHYWLTGTPFGDLDLLFCGTAADNSGWVPMTTTDRTVITDESDEGTRWEVEWRLFGDYAVYWTGPSDDMMNVNAYTLSLEQAYKREVPAAREADSGEEESAEAEAPAEKTPLESATEEIGWFTEGKMQADWVNWTAQKVLELSDGKADGAEFDAVIGAFAPGRMRNFNRDSWISWAKANGGGDGADAAFTG
jgi:hypothetical protein